MFEKKMYSSKRKAMKASLLISNFAEMLLYVSMQ